MDELEKEEASGQIEEERCEKGENGGEEWRETQDDKKEKERKNCYEREELEEETRMEGENMVIVNGKEV